MGNFKFPVRVNPDFQKFRDRVIQCFGKECRIVCKTKIAANSLANRLRKRSQQAAFKVRRRGRCVYAVCTLVLNWIPPKERMA